MKQIAVIPRGRIERIGVYVNSGRRTLEQVKAETGADYILNGGLFTGDWRACCHLRADGVDYAEDEWSYHGYGWDDADVRVMLSGDKQNVRNYICCCELIRDGKPIEKPIYNADMGGVRGRSAIALLADGDLLLLCSKDGTANAQTPEKLRDDLLAMGARSAVMLDGGGSSQCDFAGNQIRSGRVVHNFVCVWLRRDEREEPKKEATETETKHIVMLDPGHGGRENYNRSPDGRYYEHTFTLDMAQRVRRHLERCGLRVQLTREADETVELGERARLANEARAELYVSLHSNAAGGGGWAAASGLCVYTYAPGGERERAAKLLLSRMREAGVELFGAELYATGSWIKVLAASAMPAYLIEYGFHTDREEVELLLSDAYREKLAVATAKAVCDYFRVSWLTPIDEPEEPEAEPGGDAIYRVQVGAFKNRENAERMEAELRAKGYSTIVKEE